MTIHPTQILIVDDHPMVRDGLASRISTEPDLAVCGEAETIDEALRLVEELNPDLVIIDISLKTGHGIDLIKRIRGRHPKLKMLVNSMYDESIYAERSLQAGALGYINKQTAGETVITAIRTVLAGKIFISPELNDRIVRSRVGGLSEPGKSPVEVSLQPGIGGLHTHRPRPHDKCHRQATSSECPYNRHLPREVEDQTQPGQWRRIEPLRRPMGAGERIRHRTFLVLTRICGLRSAMRVDGASFIIWPPHQNLWVEFRPKCLLGPRKQGVSRVL